MHRSLSVAAFVLLGLGPTQAMHAQITFSDRAPESGTDGLSFGRGAAMVDVDGDGLLDIIAANDNMPNFFFRPRVSTRPSFLIWVSNCAEFAPVNLTHSTAATIASTSPSFLRIFARYSACFIVTILPSTCSRISRGRFRKRLVCRTLRPSSLAMSSRRCPSFTFI